MQQKLILSQAISGFSSCSKSVFSFLEPCYQSLCMFALWSGLTKLCFSACVQTETHLALFSGPDFGPEILEVHDAVISQPVERETKKKRLFLHHLTLTSAGWKELLEKALINCQGRKGNLILSSCTGALSTKELGLLISTSQMLFHNLISSTELKQGLIADKILHTFLHTSKGVRVSTLHFGACAVDGEGIWFLCAPRISVWEGKITAELLIFMAEIRDGRRGKKSL